MCVDILIASADILIASAGILIVSADILILPADILMKGEVLWALAMCEIGCMAHFLRVGEAWG